MGWSGAQRRAITNPIDIRGLPFIGLGRRKPAWALATSGGPVDEVVG
jgi:hypothetical protein